MAASAAAGAQPLLEMPPSNQTMVVGRVQQAYSNPGVQAFQDPPLGDKCGPCISKLLCGLCFWNPVCCLATLTTVNQNEQKAVLYFGKYVGTLSAPGIFFLNPIGREIRTASSKCNTLELKDIKVVDSKGNPVIISGVVTHACTSAKKACIDVEKPSEFVRLQATTAMKQVASRYPYSAAAGQPSLQTEGSAISAELVQILQEKTAIAGCHVINFELVDLSYAPEIAQVMLVKQQAEALVEARRLIVGAAVDMTQSALTQMEAGGTNLSEGSRERIASNLLSVICSHQSVTPTVALQSN